MKKLDQYIIRKFLGTFVFSLLIVISIAVIFDFSEKVDEFMEKEVTFKEIVFDYYLNFIPYFANYISYLFTFVAVIYFTSKLTSNSEIVAMLSSGISFRRILLPYMASATLLALISFGLGNYVIPSANFTRYQFEEKYIRSPRVGSEQHIHRQIASDVFIYMGTYDMRNDKGFQFSLEKFEEGKLVYKMIAKYIEWDTIGNQWHISDYYIRKIDGDEEQLILDEGQKRFKQMDTVLNIKPEDFRRRNQYAETMTSPVLNRFIEREQMRGVESIEAYLIEKHRRNSSPFAHLVLTLIGLSLSVKKKRGGTGLNIGFGLLLSALYILFMQLSAQLSIGGGVNPMLAVWIPNFIFLSIAIVLYIKAPK